MNEDSAKGIAAGLDTVLTKAVSIQQPAVSRTIARVARKRPEATPAEIAEALKRYYLSTVTTTGAAVGAAGFVPGGSIPAALLDLAAFTEASALYSLALAEVHGVPVHDLERRRTLVMAVLLGNSGTKVMEKAAVRMGAHWGRLLADAIPIAAIRQANKVLGKNFVTKYGTKQGILVIGKQAPVGIGAAIGAGGNLAFGYGVVGAARRAFGPAPAEWPSPAGALSVTSDRFPR